MRAAVTDEEKTGQEQTADQKAGRRRVLVIAGLVVAVLVVAGVLTLLLTGGGDDAADDTAGGDQRTTADTPAPPPADQQDTGAPAEPATEADVTAAKGVAEQAAEAFAAGDVDAMSRISCDPADDETPVDVGANTTAELAGEPELTGDTGTVQLRISIEGGEPTLVPLPLEKRPDGTWCVP